MTRPTPRKPERPVLWIIAGPNGSGKSSFYNRTDIEGWGGSVWIINPDLLTEQIEEGEGLPLEVATLEAVQRIEKWLYHSVEVYQTIGVETVLSSPKYRTTPPASRSFSRARPGRCFFCGTASRPISTRSCAPQVCRCCSSTKTERLENGRPAR